LTAREANAQPNFGLSGSEFGFEHLGKRRDIGSLVELEQLAVHPG
jgi:hypothetical protein